MREPGIYSEVDIDTYHAEEGISSTGINLILKSPYRYWARYINHGPHCRNPKSIGYNFTLGRAFHALLLEPDKFEHAFHVINNNIESQTTSKEKIQTKDWINMKFMKEAIQKHPVWLEIHNEKIEHSLYWNIEDNIRLRARPDLFTDKLIIDVKTTRSLSTFNQSIHEYGYLRQAAMQIDGLKALLPNQNNHIVFYFLVVENKFPFKTLCMHIHDDDIHKGRLQYQKGIAIYTKCLKEESWPQNL